MDESSSTASRSGGAAPSLRVLELLGPSTGGIRAHVAELAGRLARHGWHTVVAGPTGVMHGVGRLDKVVDVPSGWSPTALRRARRQAREVVHADGIDVIHAHGLKAALVALGLRERPPVVLTVHNLVDGTQAGWRARALRPLETRILRRVDHVIVISDDGIRRVSALRGAHDWMNVMPVSPLRRPTRARGEVRRALGVDDAAPFVVVVARLHPQKDLLTFVRAFDRVLATHPDARAVVVGEGPERDALTAEITRRGLGEQLALVGQRPNPADEMAAADVVVLSSRWEAGPLVAVECLALGQPFVTTAVGALTARLVDSGGAMVVPVGDDEAMAAAIGAVLDDPQAARAMGETGRRIVEPFVEGEALVEPIVALYAQLALRSWAPRATGDR